MNEWARIQDVYRGEMAEHPIGTKVKLAWANLQGEITEQIAPYGILQPKYRVTWTTGEVSGELSASELVKI